MTRRRSPSLRFVAVSTAAVWLSTAIAATALWPVYQSREFLILVAVTTVVASAIAIAGAVFRLPAHVVALGGLLAYVVLGVPLAVPGLALYGVLPTLDGLAALGLGTALGWKQLLTITLPVGSFQSLLVPAFVLVLVTVLCGLSLALRARIGAVAVIAPIVLFLAGILFGGTTGFFPVAASLALAATLLVWLVFFRWHDRRAAGRRQGTGPDRFDTDEGGRPVEGSIAMGARTLARAGLIVAVAAGGAVAATAVAPPSGSREVLRSAIAQPFDPRSSVSPLSEFRRYHQPGNESATMLTVAGLPDGSRIRIATLDTYDGIVYSVGTDSARGDSGTFTLVPSRVDRSTLAGERVTVEVTVGAYSGVWLPTVGAFESISFGGPDAAELRGSFYFNDNTGSAAVVRELGEGDSYRLNAVLPREPAADLLAAVTPGAARLPSGVALPEELSVVVDGYAQAAASDGERLLAAIEGLRESGYISHGVSDDEPVSRAGHSINRIAELFSEPQMIGDEEQYAVAAALMARELGFPARAVVGFHPDAVSGSGETDITGSDISAWIEVDTAQYGWVTIDPTPPEREIPERLPDEPTQVARPQSPIQPPVDDRDLPDEQVAPESAQDEADADDPLAAVAVVLRIAGWVLVAAAVLLAPFAGIAAAKMRRRRLRRSAGSPLERITGGWHEFADAVLDHGLAPPGTPTRSELAGAVGGVQPLMLAAAADRAVFSPAAAQPDEADRVWRSVDELRRTLDAGLTRRERIRARISLQSLGGRIYSPGSRKFR